MLWLLTSLRSCDHKLGPDHAYHKARFVEVVRILVLDAILYFRIGYKLKPRVNNLRILLLLPLVIIGPSPTRSELL